MSHLGRSIDEFELDVFLGNSGGSGDNRLSQDDHSSLVSDTTSLDHDVVFSDLSVVRESSHRGNVLLGQIVISRSIVLSSGEFSLSDSVDLLVHFGSVVISELTSSGNGPGKSGRVPGSYTSDSSVTSVSLLGQ